MSAIVALPLALVVFTTALWLTGRLRTYALARDLVDIPNVRSSHQIATPRGGGLAIVVATLLALPVLGALGALNWAAVCGLGGGGALVALVGFADDHWDIAPTRRLLGHFGAALWLLWWLGGLPPMRMFGDLLDLGLFGDVIAALYLVWLLNLTNFMDGIDGLAAVEVITVSASVACLYPMTAPGTAAWLGPLVLAAASLGFLVWNWPPAKIFMGDAGSGFVGFMLGALSIQAAWVAPPLFWGWIILLGVFVVDATVTLLRRILRKERVYEAHRSHAYQHAARRWGSHLPVTLAIAAINVCWLLPIAIVVLSGRIEGLLGVMLAYAPLAAGVLWLEGGTPSAA
jgi:Fuc2NAc and GlcNAc transferase